MNEELKIKISVELDKLKKGVDEAKKKVKEVGDETKNSSSKIKDALKGIGTAIATAFTVKAITDFTKEIVNASASVAAEQSAFSQIMGDYSDKATEKLRKVADETGITDTRLTASMTSMTAKWKGLGLGVEEATTNATRGLTLAADASAFWDMSLDESVGHLNSFINGSYEGGEAIGLFANDTQMAMFAVQSGIIASTKEWANLDEATKQATRLEYAENMMAQSGAVGQAKREAGEYANVQANLNEKWRQFKAQIGEPVLQNVVIPAMELLSEAVDKASKGYESLKTFIADANAKMQEAVSWANQHQTALTLIGIAVGTVTTALIAYNVAQAIANAGGIANVASLAANAVGYYALTAAEIVATTASTAFGAVMAFITSPITLVVVAIGALIAIIVLCVKHWDTISRVAKETWNKITNFTSNAVSKVTGKFEEMKTKATEKVSSMKESVVNKYNDIKSGITDKVNGAKQAVSDGFNNMKSSAIEKASGMVSSVKSKFSEIKSGITDKINGARDAVKSAIDKMKGFFNFSWSLPKIKMPHINISGKFSLNPPSAPKFSIAWNKLGGIFDKPTLFNYGGSLQGIGEDGAEAVVPLEKNTKWLDRLATMLSEKQGGNRPIVLQVDGKTFAQISVDSINSLTKQTGHLPLKLA